MNIQSAIKKTAFALTTVMLAAAVTACGSSGGSTGASDCTPKVDNIQTVSSGKLTVGAIDIIPFSSYNNGKPEGIDESIISKIAEENCLTVDWQQSTYADAVQSITSGTIDVALGSIDATEKRLQAVDFSASTYLDGMGLAADKSKNVTTIKDLEKQSSVGTVDGYLWVDDVKKILGDKLKTYPSSVELKADFDAGRIDVAIDAYGTQVVQFKDNDKVQVALANEHPDDRVPTIVHAPEAAFPYTKGNTTLGQALSDGIKEQREDGTIKKLLTDQGLSEKLAAVSDKQYVVPLS